MSGDNEDDKPTVVLDLNALKQKKQKQDDELADLVSGLEFNVGEKVKADPDSEQFASEFLGQRAENSKKPSFPIILFDFQSDFFRKSQSQFPEGYKYKIVSTLPELNQCLKFKEFQVVVFNFDVNPKAINQLTAQIKQKMPHTKTMIMARAISEEKAKLHAQTPSGAHSYYQFPIQANKFEQEIHKLQQLRKVS